ncbi:hypothetical protein Droror1_Dr00012039 [Drosera rotundifolia]
MREINLQRQKSLPDIEDMCNAAVAVKAQREARVRDKKALFYLLQDVDEVNFDKIDVAKNAKTAWELLKKAYQRADEDEDESDKDDEDEVGSGTGMGEGAGVKDVSDEITYEDQLLGTSIKKEEDALDKAPSDNDKGIEMQQDFEADAFSVCEDSVEDGDNENAEKEDEDDQLDYSMGNAGADNKDSSGRELRAKEDTDARTVGKEGNLDIADETVGLDASDDGTDAPEDLEAMNVDKEETVVDPTGLDLNEPDSLPKNTGMVVAPFEEHDDEANGDEDDENTNDDVAKEEKPSVEPVEPHRHVEPLRHEGVFIARGKEDALVTKNLVPGEVVYNEKRVSVQNEDGTKVEYRIWNPFRSKLEAAILGGVDHIWIKPGAKVLYLGAASGTTVSHVSDIVGPDDAEKQKKFLKWLVQFLERTVKKFDELTGDRP